MKLFDIKNGRLIYLGDRTDPTYWDKVWGNVGIRRAEIVGARGSFVSNVTREYLSPEAGAVLEGGCGAGTHVACLHNDGYRVIGVDYAEKTVKELNKMAPEYDIRIGDVRQLQFEDGHFAAYWSLGVIEHFWEGYESVATEMWRVVRKGGYLFLGFPYMSPVRTLKARLGFYPTWDGKKPEAFHQFALNTTHVRQDYERLGFQFVGARPFLGRQGLEDEMPRLGAFMKELYAYSGRNFLIRGFRRTVHEVVSRLLPFISYSVLLVFNKPHENSGGGTDASHCS